MDAQLWSITIKADYNFQILLEVVLTVDSNINVVDEVINDSNDDNACDVLRKGGACNVSLDNLDLWNIVNGLPGNAREDWSFNKVFTCSRTIS